MSFVAEALAPLVWFLGAAVVAGLLLRQIAGVAARIAIHLGGDREALARPSHGAEGMLERRGEARSAFEPAEEGSERGKVLVHGELWRARSAVPIAVGQSVEVVGVEGLTLEVRPSAPSGSAAAREAPERRGRTETLDPDPHCRRRAGVSTGVGSGH